MTPVRLEPPALRSRVKHSTTGSLRLRRRCIYKKIQYLTFDLEFGVKVTQNVAQCPLHYVTYALTEFEVTYLKSLRRSIYTKNQYLTFDLEFGVKVTRNVAQYPLHHVTYSATKFEVTNSKGLGGDAFTRKFNI